MKVERKCKIISKEMLGDADMKELAQEEIAEIEEILADELSRRALEYPDSTDDN